MGRLVTVSACALRQWALDFEVLPYLKDEGEAWLTFVREIRTGLLSQPARPKLLAQGFALDRYALSPFISRILPS